MGELGHLVGQLVGGGDEQFAEGARVDVAQLPALREGDDDVSVLLRRLARRLGPQQLPAHAQVDNEQVAVVELQQQVLALALDGGDLAALELGDEVLLGLVPADRTDAGGLDGFDALADDLLVEISPDGFDLR